MATTQATEFRKRSMFGSIGAGAGALFGNTGKSYYILEHKTATRNHREGETQEIIVDQIEIGRDQSCQVRFDESCRTVSRRHAAIVRDGEGWKLIQLSETNTTFLNGQRVQKEWYLRNGDEIQLSADGPRLGFLIPAGNRATVGSIGLSRRLSLFREQALRPYRNALIMMSICLVAVIAAGGWLIYKQEKQLYGFEQQAKNYEEDSKRDQAEWEQKLTEQDIKYQQVLNTIRIADSLKITEMPLDLQAMIDSCKKDIYYLKVDEVYVTDGKRKAQVMCQSDVYNPRTRKVERYKIPFSWSGTGFLLDDGKFVTARHCIQGWRFSVDEKVLETAALVDSKGGVHIEAKIVAQNNKGNTFSFSVSDFIYNDFYDDKYPLPFEYDDGTPAGIIHAAYIVKAKNELRIWSTDWTYAQTNTKGSLSADALWSKELKAGTELHVLGFPGAIGTKDIPGSVEPPYTKFSVASNGLDNSLCFLHTRGVDHGNSGGPIFAVKDNRLVVVGIVSRGSSQSEEYAYGVPISNIYSKQQ
jgi:hypothetical protein